MYDQVFKNTHHCNFILIMYLLWESELTKCTAVKKQQNKSARLRHPALSRIASEVRLLSAASAKILVTMLARAGVISRSCHIYVNLRKTNQARKGQKTPKHLKPAIPAWPLSGHHRIRGTACYLTCRTNGQHLGHSREQIQTHLQYLACLGTKQQHILSLYQKGVPYVI